MRSWMNWFPSISRRYGAGACGVAALLTLGVASAPAQDVEQRYQQAMDLFNKPDMEAACELFRQIENEKPGYKETRGRMNAACRQVEMIVKMEEKLFNDGVQFFNQGSYDDAKQKFEQAAKIPLKNPKYRSQISRYLRDMEGRQNEERLFQEGVRLFKTGKYANAQTNFDMVAKSNGPRAADARNYLQRIEQASRTPQPPPKPPEPETTKPAASEQALRAGLRAYFEGDVNAAERDLSDYLDGKGPKQALAYFFRGAARSTRYLLSGEKDAEQKKLAADDFRALKSHAARFQPPEKLVSPKILALYTEAVGAR